MRYKLLGVSKENNHLYLKMEKKRKVFDILENLLMDLGFSKRFSAAFVKWNFFINEIERGRKYTDKDMAAIQDNYFLFLKNKLDYNKVNPMPKKYFIFEDKK